MNVARTCKAEDVSVRLCFFVKVRNASGLRVAGGSNMGRMLGFDREGRLKGRTGCTGVANPGDEEGIGLWGVGVGGTLKRDAVRGSSARTVRVILITA